MTEDLKEKFSKLERLATLYQDRGRTADVIKCYERMTSDPFLDSMAVPRDRLLHLCEVVYKHGLREGQADQVVGVCERWSRLLCQEKKLAAAAQIMERVPAEIVDPGRHASFVEMRQRLQKIVAGRKRSPGKAQETVAKAKKSEDGPKPGNADYVAGKGVKTLPPLPTATATAASSQKSAPSHDATASASASSEKDVIAKLQKVITLGMQYMKRGKYEEARTRFEKVLEMQSAQWSNESMITTLQALLTCYEQIGAKMTNYPLRVLRVSMMLAESLLKENRIDEAAKALTGKEDHATDLDMDGYWELLEKVQGKQIARDEANERADNGGSSRSSSNSGGGGSSRNNGSNESERTRKSSDMEEKKAEPSQQDDIKVQKSQSMENVPARKKTKQEHAEQSSKYVPNAPKEIEISEDKCGKLYRLSQLQFEKEKYEGAFTSTQRLVHNYKSLLNTAQWSSCLDNILYITSQTDVIANQEERTQCTLYYLHMMISTIYIPQRQFAEADVILSNFIPLAREKEDIQVIEMAADVKAMSGNLDAAVVLFAKCCSICEKNKDFQHACTVYRKMHNISAIQQRQQKMGQQQEQQQKQKQQKQQQEHANNDEPAEIPGIPHEQVISLFDIHETKWEIPRDSLRKLKEPLTKRVKLGSRVFNLVLSRDKHGFCFSVMSKALSNAIYYAEFRVFVNGDNVTKGWDLWNLRAEPSTEFFDGKMVTKLDKKDCQITVQMRFGLLYKYYESTESLDELKELMGDDGDDDDMLDELKELESDTEDDVGEVENDDDGDDLLMDLKEPETEETRRDRMIGEIIIKLVKNMVPEDEQNSLIESIYTRSMNINEALNGGTKLTPQQEERLQDTVATLDNFVSNLQANSQNSANMDEELKTLM